MLEMKEKTGRRFSRIMPEQLPPRERRWIALKTVEQVEDSPRLRFKSIVVSPRKIAYDSHFLRELSIEMRLTEMFMEQLERGRGENEKQAAGIGACSRGQKKIGSRMRSSMQLGYLAAWAEDAGRDRDDDQHGRIRSEYEGRKVPTKRSEYQSRGRVASI